MKPSPTDFDDAIACAQCCTEREMSSQVART